MEKNIAEFIVKRSRSVFINIENQKNNAESMVLAISEIISDNIFIGDFDIEKLREEIRIGFGLPVVKKQIKRKNNETI
jgi:hypothetical protein